ncbi:MAG: hypothetical protein QXI16_04430, partial [Sulfolobaceae archaeon]
MNIIESLKDFVNARIEKVESQRKESAFDIAQMFDSSINKILGRMLPSFLHAVTMTVTPTISATLIESISKFFRGETPKIIDLFKKNLILQKAGKHPFDVVLAEYKNPITTLLKVLTSGTSRLEKLVTTFYKTVLKGISHILNGVDDAISTVR